MIDAMAHTLPRDLRTDPDIAADVADILDAALAWKSSRNADSSPRTT
jgi:hypothetical protein